MLKQTKPYYALKLIFDFLIVTGTFFAAVFLAQPVHILFEKSHMFLLLILLNGAWYVSSLSAGFYEDFQSRLFSYQFIRIIRQVITLSLVSLLFIFLTKENLYTRNFLIFLAALLVIAVSLRVLLFKEIIKRSRNRGKLMRRVAIAGYNETGRGFFAMLLQNPDLGYEPAGFLDMTSPEERDDAFLGTIENAEELLTDKKIQEVIAAFTPADTEALDRIISVCNTLAIRVHIIPDYFQFLAKKFQIGMIGNYPLITVRSEPLEELPARLMKRTFDIFFAIAGLLLVGLWLFPLVSVIIKLTSRGPVFYVQPRTGKSGKIFQCYKFRTMTLGADSTGFKPNEKEDARITRFGAFLRKTNLDETPQLFNVLFGSMSIIGPRPHPIVYDENYREYVEYIRLRNLVKPGITGWAQIHGLRGDTPEADENRRRITKRIEFDLWYIENWSFTLDIQILLLTAWQIVRGKNKGA